MVCFRRKLNQTTGENNIYIYVLERMIGFQEEWLSMSVGYKSLTHWLGFGLGLAFGFVALKLAIPILLPCVIEYPWKLPESKQERIADKKRTVVLAGSFNPPHNGHLAMLEYLSQRYGQVLVVIGVNPNKKYLVTPQQRVDVLRRMLASTNADKNVSVEVFMGYIWRLAKRQGATIFFRGIRSWEKDGKEERSLQILNTWGPLVLGPLWWPLPTIYLAGKPEYNHISSTLIRDLCKDFGEKSTTNCDTSALAELVSPAVAETVVQLYSQDLAKES